MYSFQCIGFGIKREMQHKQSQCRVHEESVTSFKIPGVLVYYSAIQCSWRFSSLERCSVGLMRSGLCAGHPSYSTQTLTNHVLMELALC